MDTTNTHFFNDPMCISCGDVPFHIEGTWNEGSEHKVYLDEIQILFRPTIGGETLKHYHYIG